MKESSGEPEFVPSKGLTSQEAAVLLEKWGKNELPEKVVPKVRVSANSWPTVKFSTFISFTNLSASFIHSHSSTFTHIN